METPKGALETLSTKQCRFTRSLALTILYCNEIGYPVALGEVYRSPEEAQRQAALGKGIALSVHTDKLAADIALFHDGQYLTSSKDYERIGTFWKGLGSDYRWGGDFTSRPDGNHLSLEHNGRA